MILEAPFALFLSYGVSFLSYGVWCLSVSWLMILRWPPVCYCIVFKICYYLSGTFYKCFVSE